MKTIFVASSSLDAEICHPVVVHLKKRHYNVILYESDRVADGSASIEFTISLVGGAEFTYEGHRISSKTIVAAWYRRPSLFSIELADAAYQYSMDQERRALQDSLWDLIPGEQWLNSPQAIEHASRKLTQLRLAKTLGFTIPATAISNKWQPIEQLSGQYVVLKMPYGILRTKNANKALYTTVLKNSRQTLPMQTVPFPGIWQTYIPKKREWRVTIVGSKVFSIAIYTTAEAKDDWRKHQGSDGVTFCEEAFPATLEQKCLKMLRRLNLQFGTFDFIEKPNGEFVFLEVNPNGQYGWFEQEQEFPIAKAIAEQLISIANR